MAAARYTSFAEFYPYYLSQHGHRMCRRAHFIGSSSAPRRHLVGTSSSIAGIVRYVDSLNP